MLDHICRPNGLVWSIDGSELFFVDSVARTIYRARYPATGKYLEQVSVFVHTPPDLGRPDGLAIDVEGGIWGCQFLAVACSGTIATAN
jgi:sugar lactone lactonase YvrE